LRGAQIATARCGDDLNITKRAVGSKILPSMPTEIPAEILRRKMAQEEMQQSQLVCGRKGLKRDTVYFVPQDYIGNRLALFRKNTPGTCAVLQTAQTHEYSGRDDVSIVLSAEEVRKIFPVAEQGVVALKSTLESEEGRQESCTLKKDVALSVKELKGNPELAEDFVYSLITDKKKWPQSPLASLRVEENGILNEVATRENIRAELRANMPWWSESGEPSEAELRNFAYLALLGGTGKPIYENPCRD
jgi:hypothetical protein